MNPQSLHSSVSAAIDWSKALATEAADAGTSNASLRWLGRFPYLFSLIVMISNGLYEN